MNAEELLKGLNPTIETALADACRFGDGCPDRLAEAIRYSLLAPGKRLRPSLVLLSAQACGGELEAAMPGAVAVEMIHAYSLIHDDLPAMDDDDLRRGRPTTHIQFDEATAILAGDALQAESFHHLASRLSDPTLAARVMGELARASGASGLVGGQMDDLAAEHRTVDDVGGQQAALKWLQSIHRRKTGALFAASVRIGAIIARASEEQLSALTEYAFQFGLAFQIVDDCLDCTASAEQMGKRTGKDAQRGKFTYPGLMRDEKMESVTEGIDAAKASAEYCIRVARESLKLFGRAADRLDCLAEYVLERKL